MVFLDPDRRCRIGKRSPDLATANVSFLFELGCRGPTIAISRVVDPDPDPCSIGSVDPDPYSESRSGSRRAKMTHKSRKKLVKVHVLKCWMASFES